MVAVGNVDKIIQKLCDEARKIVPGENLGAVISKKQKRGSSRTSPKLKSKGAEVLVDGRNTVVKGKEEGYFVGPTVIDHVRPEMSIAHAKRFLVRSSRLSGQQTWMRR